MVFENDRLFELTSDKDKIEKIIRDNYGQIYRYCFYHVGNRDTAQDITQEVFLKFVKDLAGYREYGKLRNYLYVIAKNTIRDYGRKRKELSLPEMPEKSGGGGIDETVERMNVREALKSLEDSEREIVILRYYQELRMKDIARILEMPVSTVRHHLKKAEKKLKTLLLV